MAGSRKSIETSQVTAVSVHEKGNDHFSKVLKFTYAVPRELQQALKTWTAVPKATAQPLTHSLAERLMVMQMYKCHDVFRGKNRKGV